MDSRALPRFQKRASLACIRECQRSYFLGVGGEGILRIKSGSKPLDADGDAEYASHRNMVECIWLTHILGSTSGSISLVLASLVRINPPPGNIDPTRRTSKALRIVLPVLDIEPLFDCQVAFLASNLRARTTLVYLYSLCL